MQAFKGQCFKVDLEELNGVLSPLFFKVGIIARSGDWKKIKDIADVNPSRKKPVFDDSVLVPYVGLPETGNKKVKEVLHRPFKEVKGRNVIHKGDILFARIEPSIFNKKYIFVDDLEGEEYAYTSTEFYIVKSKEGVLQKYLFYCLFFDEVFNQIQGKTTGSTGRRRLDKEAFLNTDVPVPSLKVQEKVVELLDKAYELKTKKEIEAKALLDSVDDCLFGELGIKVFKESGQLNLSKGKGIYTSKQDFIVFKTDLNRIKTNLDVRYFLPKYDENIKEIRKAKFQSVLLQEVAMACNRGKTPTYVDEGEIGVVKVNSIQNGEIKKLGQFVSKNFFEANEQAQVKAGAVLITATGEGSIGKIALYKNGTPALLDNHVCKLSVNASKCLPEYVCAFLNTARGTLQIEQAITGSTGQTELYAKDILNIIIPIPPLSEQERITHEIERICNKAYEARQEANKFLEQAKKQAEELIFNKK